MVNGNVTSEIVKEPVKETCKQLLGFLLLMFTALCFVAFNRPSFPPIDLEDLPTVVSDLHDNNDAGFSNEYRVINYHQQSANSVYC